MRPTTLTPLCLAGLLLLGACSADDTGDSTQAASSAADGLTVKVTDNEFTPEALEVEEGDTVTWQFEQGTHDVVFADAESEALSSGTWERTFEDAGTFTYECTIHSGMAGEIEVAATS